MWLGGCWGTGLGRQAPRVVWRWALAALSPMATICLAAEVPAQTAQLRIWLAEDPTDAGPPAWRKLRHEVLARLPGCPRFDPRRGLRLGLEWPYHLDVAVQRRDADTKPLTTPRYFEAELRLPGVGTLTGTGGFDGHERWQAHNPGQPSGCLRRVLQLANAGAGSSVELDAHRWFTAVLGTTNSTTGAASDSWQGALFRLIQTQCGIVHTSYQFESTERSLVVSSPPGQGGILLPFLAALVADRLIRPDGDWTDTDTSSEFDRLSVIAQAGIGPARATAARQLGRSSDPRASEILEGLLTARDDSRMAAMHALVQLGAVDSAVQILAAASPRVPRSESIAESCLRRLWGQSSAPQRSSLRDQLPRGLIAKFEHKRSTAHPAPRPTDAEIAGTAPSGPAPTESTYGFWDELLLALLSLIATLFALICWQQRRSHTVRAGSS